MTYKDIMTLANGGFLTATAHCLPVEHFYKFHKFRRSVDKALNALSESQKDLLRDCGIDPDNTDGADKESIDRFNAANEKILAEDAGVEVKARIPFDLFKAFYDENGNLFANIQVETAVLDNLFEEE